MADKWTGADRPNYIDNEDLLYPYSEMPYVGQYELLRLPIDTELVDHVDYWGVGRFETSAGITGFRECYNVNSEYQLVHDGPDKDCKIPNRIPVIDEDTCDTSKYIKSQSVKLVTFQSDDFHAQRSITESCARDIARIVNSKVGSVVVFGFKIDSADIRRLNNELNDINIFYYPGYNLPDYFRGLTLYDTNLVFINSEEIEERLYNALTSWDIDTAVTITQSLNKYGGNFIIAKTVDKLLDQGIHSTMTFAYKLWDSGNKDIVKRYFPDIFQLIFNEDQIVIMSNYHDNMKLKLDVNTDKWRNRLAWGDGSGDSSTRFSWSMVPIWKDNKVLFQIKNYEYDMLLRLDINPNSKGDRKGWGSQNLDEIRYNWKLLPMNHKDNLVFFIVNFQYNQALKLDDNVDKYGDRQLWGNLGPYVYRPEYFGFILRSYYIG
ncbi:microvitellogenin-like isoform X1 [Manduca sexta]|uniref:Uncharacterized protein n=1 Tax=Manduca sexta TaxID=7130 RepID=A0A921ZCK5_MANSE|nr:microvitellogenin-like isoform X1 [Manduca sexta]KAG6455167.1 hypothetical protein O3G_MSEX009074 [Manduca sexta]KAG6455168.1 hypothetical protein O3G_MSEX009074 [Manduca sexta]